MKIFAVHMLYIIQMNKDCITEGEREFIEVLYEKRDKIDRIEYNTLKRIYNKVYETKLNEKLSRYDDRVKAIILEQYEDYMEYSNFINCEPFDVWFTRHRYEEK